ncbi:hypothetical protein ATEG_01506 [Aspergillus terreus NIH2624]|uniref:Major facilitator superfamily (MFS) profile domain-containing protein n=1 Tax=Aspergillus terreus (strain NIH 2624 / FGSC A1156) TaxID=341663 RepID=Q0CXS8_ASPTN|nr:uncharacterized protein ATEG_01506 [Aspergillus terreus NIH2624]EAU38263.1 hypothetical protein ATEG_01506 [Aspergillus terreus NIH2624]
MTDFGPRAPHGPDMSGTHDPLEDMDINEKGAFDALIRPDDSYTPDGTYWADLNIFRRIKFVSSYDAKEAKRELGSIWEMTKKDPLSPVSYYFRNMVLPGAGLGLEGYVLFSIGNLKPLFQAAFPACWKKNEICNVQWIHAVDYLEIVGIIVGQILVGVLGDWIGRRWGLIQDATIMFIGLLMLTAAWGVTQNGWVVCYAWSLFFYGIGVGGEYPMTATSGMEKRRWSEFIKVISPASESIMPTWLWNLCNVGVSLAGYYCASFLIDNKLYGRKWMQMIGFLMDFILFIVPAFNFDYYTQPEHIKAFQAMYFLSSFFNQFGPNSVTFLVAAEVFPTPIRATAHGLSAAWGKAGALLASVLYNYIDTQTKFYVVPWFGLAGMVLTFIFLPDTTGLDLKEQERRWMYIREGREHEYHGPAVHPKHLSLWERIRGKAKNYNAELDYKQKVEEYRAEWEAAMSRRIAENNKGEELEHDTDDSLLEGHVHAYFHRTSPMFRPMEQQNGKADNFALPPAAQDGDSDSFPNEKSEH